MKRLMLMTLILLFLAECSEPADTSGSTDTDSDTDSVSDSGTDTDSGTITDTTDTDTGYPEVWIETWSAEDMDSVNTVLDIALDPDGNVIAVGWDGVNTWVAKYNVDSGQAWSKTFGEGAAFSVEVSSTGNIVICGMESHDFTNGEFSGSQTDFWVATLDDEGSLLWEDSLDGGTVFSGNVYGFGDKCFDLTVDGSGNIYAVGQQRNLADTKEFGLLRAYSSDGTLLYSKAIDENESEIVQGVRTTIDGDGDLAVVLNRAVEVEGTIWLQKRSLLDGTLIDEARPFDEGVFCLHGSFGAWYYPGMDLDAQGNLIIGGIKFGAETTNFVQGFDTSFADSWGFEYTQTFVTALAMDENRENVWIGGNFDESDLLSEIKMFSRDGTLLAMGVVGDPVFQVSALRVDSSGAVFVGGNIKYWGVPYLVRLEKE